MSEVYPLPMWPHDLNVFREPDDTRDFNAERDALLRRAKQDMNVPWRILPSPAAPGGPARVLAFGAVPPFFCESVLIARPNILRYESVRGALEKCLTAPPHAEGTITEEMWLSAVLQGPVKFVGVEYTHAQDPEPPTLRFT